MKYFICIFLLFLCLDSEGMAKTIQLDGKVYHQHFTLNTGDQLIGDKDTVIKGGLSIKGDNITVKNIKLDGTLLNKQVKGIMEINRSNNVVLDKIEVVGDSTINGIHIANSHDLKLTKLNVYDVKDGIYVEDVEHIKLLNVQSQYNRYGVHFMYTNNAIVRNSEFMHNITGIMLMVSNNIQMSQNKIVEHNFVNGTGITLYQSTGLMVSKNKILVNQLGLSIQEVKNSTIKENDFISNLNAIENFKSQIPIHFNHFINNINVTNSDVLQKQFINNYYDDLEIIDLNDDGIGDKPYRYTNILNQMMIKDTKLNFYQNSPIHILMKWIENRSGAYEEGYKDEQPRVEKR